MRSPRPPLRLVFVAALAEACSEASIASHDATLAYDSANVDAPDSLADLKPEVTSAVDVMSAVDAMSAADATSAVDAMSAVDATAAAPDAGAPIWSPPIERGAVSFPYRAYRCEYAVRAASLTTESADFHEERYGASPRPRNLHLTFAGDPSRSVVIQWSTDADTLASEVRFGDGALDRVARGFSFTYAGAEGRRQHEVHLCGLEPGRTYRYDVGGSAPGARSVTYHFVTAPSGPSEVTAVVTGDTRTNVASWNIVANRAMTEGADLMIFTGDAVEWGADQAQWDAFFEASPELWATLPTVWAHGNHEGLAVPYFAQLALPDHGGARGVEQWFALTYGPLRLVVLNDTTDLEADVTVAQSEFLRGAVRAVDRARAPHVVTVHHQPFYTTSLTHPPNSFLRGAWAPVFDALHVAVDLAGHVHSYESSAPLRGGNEDVDGLRVAASAGTRYLTFGGGGAELYDFSAPAPWLVTRESAHGYGVLRASATRLQWVARRDDGSTIEAIDLLR